MDKDASTILVTMAVTDPSLKAAFELAQSLGEDECENSLLQTAHFTEDALIDFTTRLFEKVRSMGLFDKGTCTRLLAGTVYRKLASKEGKG